MYQSSGNVTVLSGPIQGSKSAKRRNAIPGRPRAAENSTPVWVHHCSDALECRGMLESSHIVHAFTPTPRRLGSGERACCKSNYTQHRRGLPRKKPELWQREWVTNYTCFSAHYKTIKWMCFMCKNTFNLFFFHFSINFIDALLILYNFTVCLPSTALPLRECSHPT